MLVHRLPDWNGFTLPVIEQTWEGEVNKTFVTFKPMIFDPAYAQSQAEVAGPISWGPQQCKRLCIIQSILSACILKIMW